MPSLILDFGNTRLKAAICNGDQLAEQAFLKTSTTQEILDFAAGTSISAAILASVTALPAQLVADLREHFPTLHLARTTALPIRNDYASPDTLGYDRIAASVRGWQLFPGSAVLAIVAGTCITYNITDEQGKFLGGAIAPGLHMRLHAMHYFTDKLPLVSLAGDHPLVGTTTETSIRAGVHHAVLAETEGMIARYSEQFPGLKTVVGGGDASFLADGLKNGIFARPNLVTEGLNSILEYHVANQLL
jgi:type III pantothenate kinase